MKLLKLALIVAIIGVLAFLGREALRIGAGLEQTAKNVLAVAQVVNNLSKRIEEIEKK